MLVSPAKSIQGSVYAARSMVYGEEDLLKIGYSEAVDERYPDGDFRILFTRPDNRIPEQERLRRHIEAAHSVPNHLKFREGRREGFIEQSVLGLFEGFGLRIGFEIGGRWRTGGSSTPVPSNGRTELVRFDLEAAGIIRQNLHRLLPEARSFLEVALRFAGSRPKEPNRILGMVWGHADPTDRFERPIPVYALETFPPLDVPWGGNTDIPDIDHPPEAPMSWDEWVDTIAGEGPRYEGPVELTLDHNGALIAETASDDDGPEDGGDVDADEDEALLYGTGGWRF